MCHPKQILLSFSTKIVYLIFLKLIIQILFWFLENLAFKKETFQQYRYTGLSKDLTQSSNAVDGLKSDLEVWGGQCVISANDARTATWWVNLGSIRSIYYIKIYYRTGNVVWGM